jgi:hypothetical protein
VKATDTIAQHPAFRCDHGDIRTVSGFLGRIIATFDFMRAGARYRDTIGRLPKLVNAFAAAIREAEELNIVVGGAGPSYDAGQVA